ncbi:MAG: hypothetical protein KGQ59_02590 [Bdellovibrionales bacterium]|nr:hypothetical protein [Bdellovibrionales bacterium]
MELSGQWLSLMEYAQRNDVSLSTLRRYIKSNKVRYRSEKGRYLIWSDSEISSLSSAIASLDSTDVDSIQSDSLSHLRIQLQKAQKEIAELKTLVAFYEDQTESARGIL